MCSKCYKEHAKRSEPTAESSPKVTVPLLTSSSTTEVKKEIAEIVTPAPKTDTVSSASVPVQSPKPVVDRSRCAECKKKVGLTGIECRCGHVYCGAHRMAEKHSCSFDFKTFGRQNIEKANEKVVAQSLGEKL